MSLTKEGGKTARILLVEDEEGARGALAKILQTYGHEVTAVEDGQEAIDEFTSGKGYDIVMTDLTLPGISGWEVAKAIKKKSPETPVAVLSGWDIKKDDNNIADSGVSMVLSKPVKVREMLSAIDKLLG